VHLKEFIRWLTSALFVLFLTVLSTNLIHLYEGIYTWTTILTNFLIYLAVSITVLLIIYLLYPRIENEHLNYRIRRGYEKAKIGIIEEDGLEQRDWKYTGFFPIEWSNRLSRNLDVELIPVEEISNKYAVILNPYGEIYPETDLQYMETLSKIKKYVESGGIFVNVAGCAFWWAWSRSARTPVRLAKDETYYAPTRPQGVLIPVYPVSREGGSLVNMPLSQFFGVLTTTGVPQTEIVSQQPQDREYVGDITTIGGINKVREFRAIREPVRECIPFLRTRRTDGEVYEVFPMAGIRLKRGWLVLCGMDLHSGIIEQNINLDAADFDKISTAVENFLDSLRRGNIPIRF